ncbi:extracellular solute-binding protein [Paenibacillus agaridevorans]|uniref:extracellular solute-binding protein n=1 Tax=Paenibacillus agaridevorans TaxID=171404 RepID=UPI001BE41FF2|nr:extracellular solute-binding protein [Paenibacillus agaridevorans]
MKSWLKKSFSLGLAMLICSVAILGCTNANNGKNNDPSTSASPGAGSQNNASGEGKPEEVTLKLLVAWQGLSFLAPSDLANNPVAQIIKEKTGVTLDVEWITIPEIERLNLLFATNNMPDMVMAPYWGGQDVHTVAIKKAAREGLIMPLNELIEKYGSNMKDAFNVGVASDFRENDLEDVSFNGERYLLPMHTPLSPEDTTQWAYNVFVRKDILEALDVKPSDIRHSEDLYPLLKQIKDGNFTDTAGRPVIPSGAWQNGWNYGSMLNSFTENNFTAFTKIDEQYRLGIFSELTDKRVLFMRKLVTEGLFDPEAFRQNDTVAKEKMATGRVAVVSAHYPHMNTVLSQSLYVDHPEMEYVPVGPIADANGDNTMVESKVLKGQSGVPGMFIGADSKNAEAAMRYLNFINSEEGKLLVYLGVEGEHWTKDAAGQPKHTEKFLESVKSDPSYAVNQGIGSVYTLGVYGLPNRMFQAAGDAAQVDELYETSKEVYGLTVVDGYRLSYFNNEYPEFDKIQTLLDSNTQRDVIESAYFAASDEKALQILNDYRSQLIKGGVQDYETFMNEKAKTRDDIIH